MLDGTLDDDSLHPAPTSVAMTTESVAAWQGGRAALVADGSMIYLCT